ncbi:MAG TPA: hypothetical protein VFA54_11470 [Bryobacterales bacterium]|nr:hypothetical protein [Bryobacterales bacterium]
MTLGSQRRYAIAAYLILASVYLLYLPHAEFVLDDWLVLRRYQEVRQAGAAAQIKMLVAIIENQFHGQFRFQWLSFSFAYLLFLAVGYSPKVIFAVFLLLHVASALVLRDVLERLKIGAGPAFLGGAVFLLLPSTHGPVFWSHNCSYYIWSTFWFLLYMRSLAASFAAGRLTAPAAGRQALFLTLALFSGDPIFCLLLAGAPLAAWYLHSKAGRKATLLAWSTVGIMGALYALLINRARIIQAGVGLRYSFTHANLRSNVHSILETYGRLTGFATGSFYAIQPTFTALAFAALAASLVIFGLKMCEARRAPIRRTLLLAAGLWAAAYGPIWFLLAHEFRYDYVPSPYLALGIAALVCWSPALRLPLAGALMAWLAAANVADIRQCWIPQSDNLRLVARSLRATDPRPGDLIIVSQTPMWIGTAPNFAFLASWASTPFAEHVTGVHGLETGTDIIDEGGRLRVFHYDHLEDLTPERAAHTVLLVEEGNGRIGRRHLLADEARPGGYRLYALKGYTGPEVPSVDVTRERLSFLEGDIYFARRYAHHKYEH